MSTPSKAGSALEAARGAFGIARSMQNSALSGDFVEFGASTLDGILAGCERLRTRGDAALKQIARQQSQGQQQAPEQGQEQGHGQERSVRAARADDTQAGTRFYAVNHLTEQEGIHDGNRTYIKHVGGEGAGGNP